MFTLSFQAWLLSKKRWAILCYIKDHTHPLQDTAIAYKSWRPDARINLRGPYFNHRGNACWRLIRGRLTAGRSEQDEEWELEKQLSEESSTLFQVLCVQSNISCVFFLTSSWPEGCLIALISEEKGDSHCQERDIKLSEGTTVSQPLCPASSNHLIPPHHLFTVLFTMQLPTLCWWWLCRMSNRWCPDCEEKASALGDKNGARSQAQMLLKWSKWTQEPTHKRC